MLIAAISCRSGAQENYAHKRVAFSIYPLPLSPYVVFLLFSFSTFYFDDFAEFVCSEISCNPVIMPEGEWEEKRENYVHENVAFTFSEYIFLEYAAN